MRNSQFIRGAGVGLLTATLIFAVTLDSGKKTTPMTDREIIRKARELGMYTEEEINNRKLDESLSKVDGSLNQNQNGASSQGDAAGGDKSPGDASGSDAATGGALTASDKTATGSSVSADGKGNGTGNGKQDGSVPDGNDKQDDNSVSKGDVKITVSDGMLSHEVARMLEQAGVVKSAAEFDRYLMDHGYETYIRSGTYTFSSDADYEEIAKTLMKK